ncbi:unnamed protein product [Anisakis simplex]|uniref:RAB3GAP2_N domain-containing protein n=1 Tax=Anisakis simplex TaxID=6269 RepID=A0A0M3KGX1_ANISI|nr:unnamed protein product [Anisakis simplex]
MAISINALCGRDMVTEEETNNSKKAAFMEDYGAIENTRGRVLRFLYTESSGTIASMDFRTGVETVSRRTTLGFKTGVIQPFKDATALDSMKTQVTHLVTAPTSSYLCIENAQLAVNGLLEKDELRMPEQTQTTRPSQREHQDVAEELPSGNAIGGIENPALGCYIIATAHAIRACTTVSKMLQEAASKCEEVEMWKSFGVLVAKLNETEGGTVPASSSPPYSQICEDQK